MSGTSTVFNESTTEREQKIGEKIKISFRIILFERRFSLTYIKSVNFNTLFCIFASQKTYLEIDWKWEPKKWNQNKFAFKRLRFDFETSSVRIKTKIQIQIRICFWQFVLVQTSYDVNIHKLNSRDIVKICIITMFAVRMKLK